MDERGLPSEPAAVGAEPHEVTPAEELPAVPRLEQEDPQPLPLVGETHDAVDRSVRPSTISHRRQWLHQHRMHVLFGVLLVVMFLVYAFTTHLIPSESMLPTLKPGD